MATTTTEIAVLIAPPVRARTAFVSSTALEPRLELRLDRGPLGVDYRVGRGVAQAAVRHDPVVPQYAVEFRAQPLDGRARLRVLLVRPEIHGDAVERLERVAQHQVLGLGVDRG